MQGMIMNWHRALMWFWNGWHDYDPLVYDLCGYLLDDRGFHFSGRCAGR